MMRSLYSGVSGLRNHQTRMDVIANNISNVNTVAFKSSRTVFQDVYSQTSKSASAATVSTGGTNPIQIGLGVKLAAIDVLHTSAATQRTDNTLDLAIEGDGYFVVKQGTSTYYTRAGNLYVDNSGNLITANGDYIQGVTGKWSGTAGTSTWTAPTEPTNGSITTVTNINVAGFTGISIDSSGVIRGLNSSGDEQVIGYIAIATFTNASGLEKQGSSLYSASPNSGTAKLSVAKTNGAGQINPGGLEMSNVDLASEFTDMIITQRGFQANSRIITTSDSMLEELVNLKR